jgi:hypothetical protein
MDGISYTLKEQGSNSGKGRDFSSRQHCTHGDIGLHPASHPMSVGEKRSELEVNYSVPCSCEVKNAWSFPSLPLYALIA